MIAVHYNPVNGVCIDTFMPVEETATKFALIWRGTDFHYDDQAVDLFKAELRNRLVDFGWSRERAKDWVELIEDRALMIGVDMAELADDTDNRPQVWGTC